MKQCFIRVVEATTPDHPPTLPTTTSLQQHLSIFSIISVTFGLDFCFCLTSVFSPVSEPNVSLSRDGFMTFVWHIRQLLRRMRLYFNWLLIYLWVARVRQLVEGVKNRVCVCV